MAENLPSFVLYPITYRAVRLGNDNLNKVFLSLRASIARSVGGIVPPKEIEDIVQETYVKACQAAHKSEIRAPRSFLYRTARNLALDHVKKAETRLTVSADEYTSAQPGIQHNMADETLERVCSDEEFARFCQAVRRLPVQIRRAFVLKKVYGYTQREIAAEMGLSESTVEKHIAQGIKRCRFFIVQRRHKGSGGGREANSPATRTESKDGY